MAKEPWKKREVGNGTSVDKEYFKILFLFLGWATEIYTAYGETRISPPAYLVEFPIIDVVNYVLSSGFHLDPV